WLCDQDERTLRDAAAPGVAFAARDLLEGAADVDRAGARTPLRAPWDWRVERPVHLEDAAAVPVAFELVTIPVRELVTGDAEQRPRRQITQHGACGRQVVYRGHALA